MATAAHDVNEPQAAAFRYKTIEVEAVELESEGSDDNQAISEEEGTHSSGSSPSKADLKPKRSISSQYVIEKCVGALCEGPVGSTPALDRSLSSEMAGQSWKELPGWLRPAIMHIVLQCRTNSTSPQETDETSLQCDFECIDVPAVAIEEYAGVVHSSFPSLMTWARALVLLYKFCKTAAIEVTEYTVHRLLVTAVVATARFQGECCGVEETWGITAEDLAGMESSFHYILGGDYAVTIESCLKVLLPFDEAPCEAVLAAGLLSADRCPLSCRQRCEKWVSELVPPTDRDPALLGRRASSSAKLKKKVEMFRARSAASLSKLFTSSVGRMERRGSM